MGVVEAPYYPGAIYIISQFYTRTEVATRIAILYTGNILATAFAGLIAAGIFQLDGAHGMAGWRWLFIIQGTQLRLPLITTSLRIAIDVSQVLSLVLSPSARTLSCPTPHSPLDGSRPRSAPSLTSDYSETESTRRRRDPRGKVSSRLSRTRESGSSALRKICTFPPMDSRTSSRPWSRRSEWARS